MTKFLMIGWIVFMSISGLNAAEISEDAQRHMTRGSAAMKFAETETDYQDAVKEFMLAVGYAPDWSNAWFNLGVAHEKAGDFEEAIISFETYLQKTPEAADREEVESRIIELEYRIERAFRKLEEEAAKIASKAEPEIVSIDFPETIAANGKNVQGYVYYKDNQGDIVKIRFDVVQASQFIPFRFEPDYIEGRTSGGIGFNIQCKRRQLVTLKVTLIDRQGNRSNSLTLTFEAM